MVTTRYKHDLVCQDLPTSPSQNVRTVIVTGVGGYIGRPIVPELIVRGYTVRVLIRKNTEEYRRRWPTAEIFIADVSDNEKLAKALEGVDVAYDLTHSLQMGSGKFQEMDIQRATHFRNRCEEQNVKRIICLGGLGLNSKWRKRSASAIFYCPLVTSRKD